MTLSSFNRALIDLAALKHNYKYLRGLSKAEHFLAMVKADAYGHGMIRCSHALAEAGCDVFGVAELNEAVALRQSGIEGMILCMIGFDDRDAEVVVEHDIIPLVFDVKTIEQLSRAAVRLKKEVVVHVKVNTGMSRLGLDLDGFGPFLERLSALPGLRLGGIASHMPEADDTASPSTEACLTVFEAFTSGLKGKNEVIRHIANSGATLYFADAHHDMVRCGISLYGYYPEGRPGVQPEELLPVMSFTTRVLQVREIEAGTPVSYGGTYRAERRTRLAVLPIGYEDGFSRRLSNCGEVLIRGRRARVRGRVCMNLCMVDVTEIEGVRAGDEVVVLGCQGESCINADDIAQTLDTISYEVLCMFGNCNERQYMMGS